MSRRTPGLPRRQGEWWATPAAALTRLVERLPVGGARYVEPCAGDGALVDGLRAAWPAGQCILALDLFPQAPWIGLGDSLVAETQATIAAARPDLIITNPPWPRLRGRGGPTLALIEAWAQVAPTWCLLPAAFPGNAYFDRVERWAFAVVPIGRVSWMGNDQHGFDDAAWVGFRPQGRRRPGIPFYPRVPRPRAPRPRRLSP